MSSGVRGVRRHWALAGAALMVALSVTLLASLLVSAGAGRAASHPSSSASSARAPKSATPPARLGPTDPTRTLSLAFPLRMRSSAALASLLAAIEDPHSPQYHHYLTPAQYAEAFGPTNAERAAALAAIRALGLSVTATSDTSELAQASGTVRLIEADFGVTLYDYRAHDGSLYVAPDGAPRLPSALAAVVSGVIGLDTRPAIERRSPALSLAPQQVGGGGLDPSALRAAYDVSPLTQQGLDGSGETIAVAEIDRFRQSDVSTYDSAFALTSPTVQVVKVAGGSNTLSPEPVLDIEILQAIAPKAQIIAYESGSDLQSLTQMFDRIVSDNRAQVVSISLGACELGVDNSASSGFIGAIDSIFQRADAQGMSVLVSSGDSGAYGCQDNHLSVDLPSSSPYVTAVGGTALFLGASNGYGHEYGWEGPLEGSGGGGGVSVIYHRPSWQTGSGVLNSYSNGMRETPDVSADADPLTGYRIYYSGDNHCAGNDCWTVVGGTSAAAPFWAGLIALANQRGHRKLGFLNPALYAIAQTGAAGGGAPYHDVTGGGNLYYQATPGWDYSTGLGSPDAAALTPMLLAR
ncbi:MAG TPA: S53 family peptidase [Ktedonobacterales bacterium]|nr:S53 family peptidase [Ktedonobacterales bacterium]